VEGDLVRIDHRVFLSRPEDVPLGGSERLGNALASAASGADRIVILSAYYGTGYLEAMFAALPKKIRRACSLTMIFGVETASRLPHAVEELRKFQKELVTLGFHVPSIRLFNKGVPFHTKLYHFKRSTQPVWFIGSANASPAIEGARHELMLRLTGRHDALTEYVNGIIKNSVIVEEADRECLIVSDIRSFLLNGSLCYRPLSRVNFTFEACQINADHRRVLRDALATASEVPHADPQTEGFGFSLTNAVRQITDEKFSTALEADAGTSTSRLKFRHMAVETIYGYWLPAAYATEIQKKLRSIDAKSVAQTKEFATKLENVQQEKLDRELENHVDGLRKFFSAHSVLIEPKADYKRRFRDFVKGRKIWLADEERIERMVRRLHIEQMPDIWGDEEAAQKFEDSFFEDLAMRFDNPGKSWIVGVLQEELKLQNVAEPEGLKAALADRLKSGFSDSIWWGDDDDDDDE
jgi:hypothetical protein